jgi:hypothetical protein
MAKLYGDFLWFLAVWGAKNKANLPAFGPKSEARSSKSETREIGAK